jgi:predicted nucleic acid-binding protein
MPFLDTNVFLRHLLNDDPIQSPSCFALIQAIERRKLSAWTSDLVISEIVFVLSNKKTYGLGRDEIRDRLLPLIKLPNLKIPRKRLYGRVFDLYVSFPIDYVDCYHAALLEHRKKPVLYSYDTDFDRIATLRRAEP